MFRADLTPEQRAALRVLRAFRRAREALPEAVRTLDGVLPHTEIAAESGLHRNGVAKMLARHDAAP